MLGTGRKTVKNERLGSIFRQRIQDPAGCPLHADYNPSSVFPAGTGQEFINTEQVRAACLAM